MSFVRVGLSAMVILSLAGCGGPGPSGGPPRAKAGTSGCKALQKEIRRYERKGVASWAEAKNAGRKLSKSKEADLRIYNDLLNKYLGGQCHI